MVDLLLATGLPPLVQAPPARLERATYGFEVRRSVPLSYGGVYETGRVRPGRQG